MKNKLNIALVHDNIGNLIDGAIISTTRFGELLKKGGHNVIFFSGRGSSDKQSASYHVGIKMYKFPSMPFKQAKRNFFITLPSVKKLVNIFKKEKIDIVHIMIPTPSVSSYIRAAKKSGIPIVIHSHMQPENILLYLPKILQNRVTNSIFYRYLVWVYKRGDIIICPSKFAERLLKKYGSDLKTCVISNGVDLSKFKKRGENVFIKKHHINPNEKRVLFVGRLDPEKKIDTLIKSMKIIVKRNKNVHLDIVGSGILYKNLNDLVCKLELEKNVTFYGKISEDELVGAYNAANIFVLPSVAELEGMVVLEAMACGKPIIVSDSKNSASADFVNKNGYLFKSGDEKDLSEKIEILLLDKGLCSSMGKKSYKIARDLDINKSVSKLEHVYYAIRDGRRIYS